MKQISILLACLFVLLLNSCVNNVVTEKTSTNSSDSIEVPQDAGVIVFISDTFQLKVIDNVVGDFPNYDGQFEDEESVKIKPEPCFKGIKFRNQFISSFYFSPNYFCYKSSAENYDSAQILKIEKIAGKIDSNYHLLIIFADSSKEQTLALRWSKNCFIYQNSDNCWGEYCSKQQ